MKRIGMSAAALALAVTPAYALEAVANPSTGDNSMVALALAVMGGAAVLIIVVLLLGRGKKKKKKK